jgi:hypothetical protein
MDRWISYIDITTSNRSITLQEGTSTASFNLPLGRHWCYRAGGTPVPGFPSLYDAIETGMSNAFVGGNAYVIENAVPTNYRYPLGLRIRRSAGSFQFRLNGTSTFPLSYLGFEDGVNTGFSLGPGTIQGTSSYKGVFLSYGLLGLEGAVDRRVFQKRDIRFSDQDTRRAYTLRVRDGYLMRVEYRYLLATSIFEARASDALYANEAKITVGDGRQAFETFWKTLGESGQVGLQKFLIAFGSGTTTLGLGSDYVIAMAADQDQVQDFEQVITLESVQGELYRMSLDLWVESA